MTQQLRKCPRCNQDVVTSQECDVLCLQCEARPNQNSLSNDVLTDPEKLAHEIHSDCLASEKEIADALRMAFVITEARMQSALEKAYRGDEGARWMIWPDWIYEARKYREHAEGKIPWLPDLLKILGWQGGTVHQAMSAVARLVEAEKQRECGGTGKAAKEKR